MTKTTWETIEAKESHHGAGDGIVLRYRGPVDNREWQVRTKRSFDIDFLSPEDAIKILNEVSAGLHEAMIDVSIEEEYGSSYIRQTISGWADDVGPRLVARVQHAVKVEKRAAELAGREYALSQLRQIRRQFPDLLETGAES